MQCTRPACTAEQNGMSAGLTSTNIIYTRNAAGMYAGKNSGIKIDERGCFYGYRNVNESW